MKPFKIHRGLLSIEVAITLVIVMLASVLGLTRYKQHMNEMEWTVEARRMDAISAAAKSYIRDNRDTLINQVAGGSPVTITGTNLQAAGYLPDGFTMTNTSAQTFVVSVARNPKATTKLVAFVLTQNGSPIEYKGLRYIAQAIDGAGGYIQTTNVAEGAYGGWKINLASYGLTAQAGHLAAYLSSEALGTDDQESDRLYRYAITSRPELNRMHAAIDMNNNNINNAATVNAVQGAFSGNLFAANGMFEDTLSAKNGLFTQGVTAKNDIRTTEGWLITQDSKGWMNSTYGGGLYMSDNAWLRSLNNKGIYTGGEIRAGTVHSEGDLLSGGTLQLNKVNLPGNACTPAGAISRDNSGNILSCVSGIWRAPETGNGTYKALGTFTHTYSAKNTTNKLMRFYVYGGNPPPAKVQSGDADNCQNTFLLRVDVNGIVVHRSSSANSKWHKSGSAVFDVPPGASFSIYSDGMLNYGCNYGRFSVVQYL